jgi:hypothetical protein
MHYRFLGILILFLTGCSTLHDIKLSGEEQYNVREDFTSIILLESFIVNNKCDSLQSQKFTNSFLCKVTGTNDTILVYSICKPPHDFLKKYNVLEHDLVIDRSKISKEYPMEILVNVPDKIRARRYPYVVTELIRLLY